MHACINSFGAKRHTGFCPLWCFSGVWEWYASAHFTVLFTPNSGWTINVVVRNSATALQGQVALQPNFRWCALWLSNHRTLILSAYKPGLCLSPSFPYSSGRSVRAASNPRSDWYNTHTQRGDSLTFHLLSFLSCLRRDRKIARNDYELPLVCPSVRPRGTTRLPLNGFSLNFIRVFFQNLPRKSKFN